MLRTMRMLCMAGAVAMLGGTVGTGVAWAGTAATEDTIRVCVNAGGAARIADTCGRNERPFVLVTEAAISALRAALDAGDTSLAARIAALEAADIAQNATLAAHEAAGAVQDARLAALENADLALSARITELESRLHMLELAVLTVNFNKVFDGGHYASYIIKGTGFLPGSTVTSGVGLTTIVAENGMFEIFGGNLFCDEDVTMSGRDADNNLVTRSTPVVCDSEIVSPVAVTFTKIFDGGHYASYSISGSGFLPGSTVTSGAGLTAVVGGAGTFTGLFGGNLFCADEVTVSGTDGNGVAVTRTAPVVCNSEGDN